MIRRIDLTGNMDKIIIDIEAEETIVLTGYNGGSLELEINLNKEGSYGIIYGVVMGEGDSVFNLKTRTNHNVHNTKSRVHIKGIFRDKSILNYEGMINVSEDAQLTDAYLQNDNLILSENAKVNSSPQLEIKADDVKASHGVTISTIDEIDKFYLKSRGLNDNESEKLIVSGFVNDILSLIES